MKAELIEHLKTAEGFSGTIYVDPISNKRHIGYGRNLDDVPLSRVEATELLRWDITRAQAAIRGLSKSQRVNWWGLPPRVAFALTCLTFQMGARSLAGFTRMWQALREADFIKAAYELLDSRYATQTPERAKYYADLIAGEKEVDWQQ